MGLLGEVEARGSVLVVSRRLEVRDNLLEQREGGQETDLLLLGALDAVLLGSDCEKAISVTLDSRCWRAY